VRRGGGLERAPTDIWKEVDRSDGLEPADPLVGVG
jgi:hypothetical protein